MNPSVPARTRACSGNHTTPWARVANGNGTTLTNPYYANTPATGPDPTGSYKRTVSLDGSWYYDIPREFYFGIRVDL